MKKLLLTASILMICFVLSFPVNNPAPENSGSISLTTTAFADDDSNDAGNGHGRRGDGNGHGRGGNGGSDDARGVSEPGLLLLLGSGLAGYGVYRTVTRKKKSE